MPDETGILARLPNSRACAAASLPIAELTDTTVHVGRHIRPQQAIVLRDAGRALLAVAASDVATDVPELTHMGALQDYQDDLFVAGYLDETFQKQVDTEFLAHDVRDLAHRLIAIRQDVSLATCEDIVATAFQVAARASQTSVRALARGISRVVDDLVQELRDTAVA